MNFKTTILILVFIALVASPACATSNSVIYYPSGGSGGNTTNIYNTYISEMDQTPNQTAATINVNYTFTGASGTNAIVSNIGTSSNAIFDFTIPRGNTGADGSNGVNGIDGINGTNGVNGTDGHSATIVVNETFTLPPGSFASVTNIGNVTDAVFNFFIPAGDTGAQGQSAYVYGNNTEVLYNIGGNATTSPCMNFDNTTGKLTACFLSGDGTDITNVTASAVALSFNVREGGVGNIYKGQSVYISGSTGVNVRVLPSDNTATDSSRVVGLMVQDVTINGAGQVRRAGELTGVDTRPTNVNVNPNGETWAAGDLLFATAGGGLTNVRPTSGRSVKVAYSLRGSHLSDTLLSYPMENPVWLTSASGENVVTRLGDSVGVNKLSIRNYANTEVAFINSNGNATVKGLNATGVNISNVADPIAAQDALTLNYFNTHPPAVDLSWNATYPLLSGLRTLTGKWNFGGFNASNVGTPTVTTDAATWGWVVGQFNSSGFIKTWDDGWNASYRTASSDDIQDEAINASMRQNVSTYVIAVNNSMRANVSTYFSPMVSNKTPTINLGSGTADATTYLRGDQTWAAPPGGGGDTSGFAFTNGTRSFARVNLTGDTNITGITNIIGPTDAVNKSYVDSGTTANLTIVAASEFFDPSTQAIPGFLGAAVSSGTVGAVATTANHPGVIYMRDSTTANGGYRYGCAGTQLIAGGEYYEVVFQPVGVRAGQTAKLGWSDSAAATTLPVDGVFFNISATGAAITLRGNTSSNSVRSGTLTSYAPTTATWYRGTILVNPAANLVTYTLYSESGASLWTDTVSTNIPTGAGRVTSPCITVAESSTDAAADILRLDYTKWAVNRSLAR